MGRPWRRFLMNRADIVNRLSEQSNLSQKLAKLVVDTIIDTIRKAIISGERVEIRGFGSFSLRSYKPYKGRNPKNGEIVEVPAKRLPYFKVGKELREMIWENH
jgi:integration host factor subunit beta